MSKAIRTKIIKKHGITKEGYKDNMATTSVTISKSKGSPCVGVVPTYFIIF